MLALCAALPCFAERAKPNVVVLLVDDLGSGDVSCLFRDVVKTPNIDRLAKQGVKFSSGYSTAPLFMGMSIKWAKAFASLGWVSRHFRSGWERSR